MPAQPPVALFTYNRPRHTRQVLEALARTPPARLVVFQDGLREGDDPRAHNEVAQLLGAITFSPCELIRRPRNLGLADSIIAGVTEVLAAHETVLVLEDDCVPSSQLLAFITFALARFRDEPRVFSVSGYALPAFPRAHPYDVCFSPLSASWGWATWRDRWAQFDAQATGWQETLRARAERRRFSAPGTLFPLMLRNQMDGLVNSWAIRWYHSLFRHRAVCVWPLRSFVRNIGMDGSGTHDVRTREFDVELCESFDPAQVRVPPTLAFDPAIQRAFRSSFAVYSWRTLLRVLRHPGSWPRVLKQLLPALRPERT